MWACVSTIAPISLERLLLRRRRAPAARQLEHPPEREPPRRPHLLVQHHLVLQVVQRPGQLRQRVHLHVAADRRPGERDQRLLREPLLQPVHQTALRPDDQLVVRLGDLTIFEVEVTKSACSSSSAAPRGG
jgi:hypothetical protein